MRAYVVICVLWLSVFLTSCGGGGPTESSIARRVADEEGYTVVFVKVATAADEGGIGSGIVVDAMGRILTCYHVVKDIKEGWVKPLGGDWMAITAIVSEDESKDLAVLEVDPGDHVLQVARLGSVSGVRQGDPVVAIGNPLGEENTVTDGIVSAIRDEEGYTMIQHTAPISPGNSGGPLFNQNGEAIGVVSFSRQNIQQTAQSLNYAVAIDEARPLIGATEVVRTLRPGLRPPGSMRRFSQYITPIRFFWIAVLTLPVYLLTTFILFPGLIRNPQQHPSTAFGFCAMLTWGWFAFVCAGVFSGFFDYVMGWRSWFVGWLLAVALMVGVLLIVLIWIAARPHSGEQRVQG